MRISADSQRLEPDETKILVADDDEGIRRLFSRIPIRALSAARIVGSAAAAREAGFSGVSAAFIDVDLVEAGAGIGLAEELRSVEPNCQIYLMSGNPSNAELVSRAGFGSMIEKPFEVAYIQRLLALPLTDRAPWA